MSLTGLVARGRRAAEALMTDTVTIVRPGATITASSGAVTTASEDVYSGKARWKPAAFVSSESDVATAVVTVSSAEVHLPVGSCVPEPGDVVTLTASLMRPDIVGSTARVRSRFTGSTVTSLRIPIEEF